MRLRRKTEVYEPRLGPGFVYAILRRLWKLRWQHQDPVWSYCEDLRWQGFFFRPSDTKEVDFEFGPPPGPPGVDNVWQNEDETHDIGCPDERCHCKRKYRVPGSPEMQIPNPHVVPIFSSPLSTKIEASHTQPLKVISKHLSDFNEQNGKSPDSVRERTVLHSHTTARVWEFEDVDWPRHSAPKSNGIDPSMSHSRAAVSTDVETQPCQCHEFAPGYMDARFQHIMRNIEPGEELCTCEGRGDEIIYHGLAREVQATYGFLRGSRLVSAVLI